MARKHHKSLVQDFMTEDPVVVSPRTTIIKAYSIMFENDIRRLPVVEDGVLAGIITLSDIQRRLPNYLEERDIETNLQISTSTVASAMTEDPVTVTPEDTIGDAADLMLEYQVSGLPVVQDGHVMGIITESDIFKLIVDSWSD